MTSNVVHLDSFRPKPAVISERLPERGTPAHELRMEMLLDATDAIRARDAVRHLKVIEFVRSL